MNKNVLGDRIKKIRNELKLTGEEFGKKLSVTKVAVSNWENGNRAPDTEMLIKICDLGNVSLDWLLGRAENKDGKIINYSIDKDDVIMEVSSKIYPEGLTKEEVIEKLKIIKNMENLGIVFPKNEE